MARNLSKIHHLRTDTSYSSIVSGIQCSVSTLYEKFKQQLVPSIKSHNLQVSYPLHNIILNVADKKTVQNLLRFSDWHQHSCACHIGDKATNFAFQNYVTLILLLLSEVLRGRLFQHQKCKNYPDS